MNRPALPEAAPLFVALIDRIRKSGKFNDDAEILSKLNSAEMTLQTIVAGISVRQTLRVFAEDIKLATVGRDDTAEDTLIQINGKRHAFEHLRIGAIAGLLATTWGIYDNIVQVCNLLMGTDGDKSPPKNMFTFLEYDSNSINRSILGKLRKAYGYPVAFSYQIRNSVMHRLPHLSDRPGAFVSISVSDGYLVAAPSYQELIKLCILRNDIKPRETENFDFLDDSNQCLLQVIDLLQTYTDACAVGILEETINQMTPLSMK